MVESKNLPLNRVWIIQKVQLNKYTWVYIMSFFFCKPFVGSYHCHVGIPDRLSARAETLHPSGIGDYPHLYPNLLFVFIKF